MCRRCQKRSRLWSVKFIIQYIYLPTYLPSARARARKTLSALTADATAIAAAYRRSHNPIILNYPCIIAHTAHRITLLPTNRYISPRNARAAVILIELTHLRGFLFSLCAPRSLMHRSSSKTRVVIATYRATEFIVLRTTIELVF